MLEGANFRKPTGVNVHGFVTVNGAKMSKSKGTFIKGRTYLDHLNPEYLRYYYASKLSDNVVDIDLNFGRSIPVNRVVIRDGLKKQLVYYWFKQRGRDIANEYWMKWYILTDSLSIKRTDGSLVRITTPIGPDETVAIADERLQGFLSLVNPLMADYVPG